jgi:16S rRNA (cytidine1402-2'-O)-methyltransferase
VLLVEGCAQAGSQNESDPQRVLEILLRELPLKQAVGLAAEITGTKKNTLYEKALNLKKEGGGEKK